MRKFNWLKGTVERGFYLGAVILFAAPLHAQNQSACMSMTYIEPKAGLVACSELLEDPALPPKTRVRALISRAFFSFTVGDYAAVTRDLDAMEGQIDDDPLLYLMRGKFRFEIGQYAAAFSDLDQALALDPHNLEALVYRGRTHEALGRLRAAQADFDNASDIDPLMTEALRAPR